MARILIEDAEEGMVLDEPVTNANGKVLLAQGSTLSEKHLRAMKMWGIIDVSVKGTGADDGSGDDSLDPALLEEARQALAALFQHCDLAQPIMQAIFHQAAVRHAKSR